MKMTVRDLRRRINGVDDNLPVVFQGNIEGEDDFPGTEDPSYTTCMGHVYNVFLRTGRENELVIDCAITERE